MAAKITKVTKSVLETFAEELEQEIGTRFNQLADQYRREVMIPAARKNKLRYIAGMGVMAFYGDDGLQIGSREDALDEGYPDIAKIYDVLEVQIPSLSREDYFGWHVDDITEKDW